MFIAKRLFPIALLLVSFVALQPSRHALAGSGAANGSANERAAGAISAGSGFNCWVQSGAAKCIGGNASGQLGDGTTTNRIAAVTVTGLATGVVAVAAGDAHACALTSAGEVKCWGANNKGQLGNGSTTDSLTPVQAQGLSSAVARIDVDADNSCALTVAGRAMCWGANQTYGTGSTTVDANTDGEFDPVLVPTEVTGLSTGVVEIAIGGVRTSATVYKSHGCAVTQDGDVKCWGANQQGQLGSAVTHPAVTPTLVALGTTATALALGSEHSCALTSAGAVKCWGNNTSGQLGLGVIAVANIGVIGDVLGPSSGIAQISAGRTTTCAVSAVGALTCWGTNIYEAIRPAATLTYVSTPEIVYGLSTGIAAVSVGDSEICALKTSGDLPCWGANGNGQTADGYNTRVLTPQSVVTSATNRTPLAGFQSIGTSMWTSCGVLSTGAVKCWGYNYYGNLGDGTQTNRSVPTSHSVIQSGAVSVSTTSGSSTNTHCAIMADTTLQCWGANAYGLKGFGNSAATEIGTRNMLSSIGPDVPLTGVANVSVGNNYSCVVVSGAAKCSGSNTVGALGNGTTTASNLPTQVSGLTSGVVALASTSYNSSCAVLSSGSVNCWGNGQQYQLGNGSVANRLTPYAVTGINDASAITAGDYFYCALVTGGAVKCWGYNAQGQLGNGTTTTGQTPVSVSGISGATSVVAGARSVCAVMADTTVKCWGWNYHGIFGNGTTTDSSIPVTVPNLTGVTALALGSTHICALLSDTTVKCWGSQQLGQIGDSTLQNRAYDGQTFVATGVSAPQNVPAVTTTTTPTTSTTTSTTSTTTTTFVVPTTVVPSTTSVPTATIPIVAASKPGNRIDNTVYEIAPALVGTVSAFNIMTKADSRKLRAVTQTPKQCVAGGTRVYTLVTGECRVLVRSLSTGKLKRIWQSTVVRAALSIGTKVRIYGSLPLDRLSDTLPTAQYEKIFREVKGCDSTLIVGHTAIFSGNSPMNIDLSGRRALKTRDYLLSRGIEGSVEYVGIGGQSPISTVLTEKAQSKNRRVTLYCIPKLTTSK